MKEYTIAICDVSGEGTHFLSSYRAAHIDDAKKDALTECAINWGCDIVDIQVLFVAEGDVTFLEYQEPWL